MSYLKFRYIAGADNAIDRNEFYAREYGKYPYLDPYTMRRIADEKFALMDRNGDGRIDYREYRDAKRRRNYYNYGYYPSQYGYGYGHGYGYGY